MEVCEVKMQHIEEEKAPVGVLGVVPQVTQYALYLWPRVNCSLNVVIKLGAHRTMLSPTS